MNTIKKALLAAALVLGVSTQVTAKEPPIRQHRNPTYLLLRTPRTPAKNQPQYGYTPGRPKEVVGRGYTYGWFGVKRRRHWSRHFGFYRNYTEWKAR